MGIKPRPIKGGTMRQVDLGDIQGPILIFGGAYSNLQATQALIDAAQTQMASLQNAVFLQGTASPIAAIHPKP